jgi:DNA repair exonuclease SbcCD ATPase subunit
MSAVDVDEAELAALQRQYRIAEGDRKTYTDESQNTLRKQREQIAKLENENGMLQEEYKLAMAAEKSEKSKGKANQKLGETLEERKAEVQAETDRLAELKQQLKEAERDVDKRRRNLGGVSGVEAHKVKLESQIRTLENRLEKALKKYNQQLAENAKWRQKIDHLKQERNVFDTMHRRLEKELSNQKRQMAELIDKSHKAHESRDEAQQKTQSLTDKAAKVSACRPTHDVPTHGVATIPH